MTVLAREKESNEIKWYRNFALSVLFINLVAFGLFQTRVYLNREVD